jgi:endonuclease/exonuclease/phosphatase (EEP) superfamily protein YafD
VRRTLLAFGWLVAVGYAGLHGLLALGVSRPVPIDWLWSFVPHVFLPVWFGIVAALVVGSRALAVAFAVLAAVHLAWLLPVMTGEPDVVPPGAAHVRVVTANVCHCNDDLGDLLDEVVAADADVIVLQEVTLAAQPEIFERLSPTHPEYALMARPDAFGSAVFSKHQLTDEQIIDLAGIPMHTIGVELGGRTVRLWNVHTKAPTITVRRQLRDIQLDQLTDERRFVHEPLLAAGDFNASYWNDEMTDLLRTDLRDAHAVVGRGLDGTWKGLPIEPLLDHVLVSPEWGVTAVRTGDGAGSDHRVVVADLFLRP